MIASTDNLPEMRTDQLAQLAESVVVSTGVGRLHMFYAAEAAQRGGYLSLLITTFFTTPRLLELADRLERWGFRSAGRLRLRYHPAIPAERVVVLSLPEVIDRMVTKVCSNSPKLHDMISQKVADYYSFLAAGHIPRSVRVVHSRSGYSRHILTKCANIGARVIAEQSIAHPGFLNRIYLEEYERYGTEPQLRSFTRFSEGMLADMKGADYVVTNSDFAASTLTEHGVDPRKIRIVYLGVDVQTFRPLSKTKDGKFRILFAGAIELRKGVQYLLEAYNRLQLPNSELMLVGNIHPDIRDIVERYQGEFTHIPRVPQYELPGLYNSASVFVIPSLGEGSARVTYEAMACGCPVIATHNTGSVVRDGLDGYVIPIRDVDALCDRILRLYNDRRLRETMGLNAYQYIQESFTWERFLAGLQDLYTDIALAARDI